MCEQFLQTRQVDFNFLIPTFYEYKSTFGGCNNAPLENKRTRHEVYHKEVRGVNFCTNN